jgi:cytochrome c biogenesis protein CcdA/glutaredoxin
LLSQYGDTIEINYLDISDLAVLKQMMDMEAQYSVSPESADVPEVYVGEYALIGADEIRARLPELIDQYLAQGGVDLVPLPGTAEGEPGKPVARFILFYGETCPHCHEIMEEYLPTVYEKYGDQVEYRYIEVWSDTDQYLTLLGLEKKLGVPEESQGSVPALVIGDRMLIGSNEIPDKLETFIDEYLVQGGVDFPSLDDLPEVTLPTPQATVQILVFLDSGHADLEALRTLMSSLGQKYGSALQPYAVDVSQVENADKLAQLNDALGVSRPAPGTPEVLIERQLLVGIKEIEDKLPGLIEGYLAQGGVSIPPWEELLGGGPSTPTTPAPAGTGPAQASIYMAYFERAGCQECARTALDLRVVQERYPRVVVESFSMEEAESKTLNEWLSEKYGVPEEKRLSSPMIFVGDDVLIGREANLNNLLTVTAKYAATGAARTWDDLNREQAEQSLMERFQSFGLLTVLGAGLIDGLNPCAFATLVFFISYLTFTGRRGRDILFVGLSFALGVFLTYLLVGAGLLKAIQSLGFFTALGRWLYLVTALLCVVLAVLTFRDFFKARQGQVSEMALKLPLRLRRRIHKVIRESAQVRAFVVVAFATGFVVSLIELACTGQVYLPTIVYVMSRPELATQAFFYLFLYCLMFIVPLVVVFALSYFGTTSEQLGRFVNRHTSTIKLITGLVFVGLALWMTWTLAPLFGVQNPWGWMLLGTVLVLVVLGVIVLRRFEKPVPKASARRRRRSRA